MTLDLKTIEALAPDQASLQSASKLTKRSNWVRLQTSDALLWGECQGSGSNPYRVVVDATDGGCRCTCPSRKFPCKHGLALMWLSVSAPAEFTSAAPMPEWVTDWVGRRRKSGAAPAALVPAAKSIGEAAASPFEAAENAQAAERREAAQQKRAEATKATVAAGIEELDGWISDQLRLGLSAFVDASSERCRRIAARLVDAKAAALASRLDEFPGTLMTLRSEERPEAAMRELGKLVLLGRAWRAAPDDPELHRLVATTEAREQVLADLGAPRISAVWEVLGERIRTRRDGLVSHATWLLALGKPEPCFALLQDFYPASAGRRAQAFASGERFEASLAFYPARRPLRAVVAERRENLSPDLDWPAAEAGAGIDPLAAHVAGQDAAPWVGESPMLLPAGSLQQDDSGTTWWQAESGANATALPIAGSPPEAVYGMALAKSVGLWNGARLDLLAAKSDFGRVGFA